MKLPFKTKICIKPPRIFLLLAQFASCCFSGKTRPRPLPHSVRQDLLATDGQSYAPPLCRSTTHIGARLTGQIRYKARPAPSLSFANSDLKQQHCHFFTSRAAASMSSGTHFNRFFKTIYLPHFVRPFQEKTILVSSSSCR